MGRPARITVCCAAAALAGAVLAQGGSSHRPAALGEELSGDVTRVHDPALIRQDDSFYLFTTGQLRDKRGVIPIRRSRDLVDWRLSGAVFQDVPTWAKTKIKGAAGLWAPDVSYVNGQFRVYYSVSTFGSNRSAIGLATSPTLDPSSPDYRWTDHGEVYASTTTSDHNAIDPNLVVDRDGRQWLAFGSFWTGIKMIRLDPATGKWSAQDRRIHSLARRPAPGAVEAPFIIHRGAHYYLFVSHDFCCRGARSTYHTVVGRSRNVLGPYLDRQGRSMLDGGGTLVLHADFDRSRRWRGPGHVAILHDGGRDHIVYHAYDTRDEGRSALRIQPLEWTPDGWPVAL